MRIAVNARLLLKDRLEGMGWFTLEVVRQLVERHPEHEYLLLFDRPYDSLFGLEGRAEGVVVPPPARHPLLFLWWFEVGVPRALRRWGADVLLSADNFLSLSTPVPTVLVTHDIAHRHFPEQVPFSARWYYRFMVPRFLRRAERIVTVSEFTRQDLLQHYPVDAGKLSVACNGCRPGFRPLEEEERQTVQAQWSEGRPYFFYTGSVHPRKNVDRLIRAFDRFLEHSGADVRLLIGGRLAWQTGAVRAALESIRRRDAVRLLGYVPEEELPRLLGASLGLVYVSLFEGFGVPLLEAMHCEVPIIASNVSSLPEVAGPAALLVDPTDETEIAQAMHRLHAEVHLRERLVAEGRRRRTRFSWEKAATVVHEALEAAVQSPRMLKKP